MHWTGPWGMLNQVDNQGSLNSFGYGRLEFQTLPQTGTTLGSFPYIRRRSRSVVGLLMEEIAWPRSRPRSSHLVTVY